MSSDDDPFELIKKGNAFESASDHWRSAEFYSRASMCLRCRADDLSSQIREGGHDRSSKVEKRKVASLFRAQSLEYLYKGRHCLLEALRFENDQDRSRTLEVARSGTGSLDPLFSMISSEDSKKRNELFQRLFSGCTKALEVGIQANAEDVGETEQIVEDGPTTSIGITESSYVNFEKSSNESSTTTDQIDDRQQSLESRLAKLDSSLLPDVPPPFVSGSRGGSVPNSNNRLDEIQRGLGRLGVTLPDSTCKRDLLPDNMSAEDQVKLLINQVKDEVHLERGTNIGGGSSLDKMSDAFSSGNGTAIDENDSMFEGFEDDEYDIDVLLSRAESLAAKTGVKLEGCVEFHSELVQIRKVQALLLEARLCLEMAQTKSHDEEAYLSELNEDERCARNDERSCATRVAKKKARVLVANVQDCIGELLNLWKSE
ncbi:hypothetical protein ACHAXA_006213 [Cyclostephanos tholiformis]|uniref:Uncharacterized protein n=1 Tax=Cyclostephanos tholiformis TaxID=382380 RepID=A0ABD3SE71_9STRA